MAASGRGGGSLHWRRQRMTAVALVPLVLIFVVLMPVLAASTHDELRELMGTIAVPIFLIVFLVAGIWHMKLGLEAVIDDYAGGGSDKVLPADGRCRLMRRAAGGRNRVPDRVDAGLRDECCLQDCRSRL